MIRVVAAALLLASALAVPASAQLTTTFVGPGASFAGPPPTPCTVGAVDLSLTTGCNIPQFMDGVIP